MLDFRCFPSASLLKDNILRAEWERLKRRRISAFFHKVVNCVMPRNGKFRSLFAEILQSWGLGKFSTQVPEALTTAVCISASH